MQRLKHSHQDAALRVLRYLKRPPGLGLFFPPRQTSFLTVFYDSDWAACPNTRRVTVYVVKLGDSLISWKSIKQQTASRSWVNKHGTRQLPLLVLHGSLDFWLSCTLLCYNKAAIQRASNPIFYDSHSGSEGHFVIEKIKLTSACSHFWFPSLECLILFTLQLEGSIVSRWIR